MSARITHVKLDTPESALASPEMEMERHKAISDLLYENSFQLLQPGESTGPYQLRLAIVEDRLHLEIDDSGAMLKENISLSLKALRRLLQDYSLLVDNFYKSVKAGDRSRLEILDEGRRSLHDEGAESLIEALENKVKLDKLTARRLFSLLYVLHMRSVPTF